MVLTAMAQKRASRTENTKLTTTTNKDEASTSRKKLTKSVSSSSTRSRSISVSRSNSLNKSSSAVSKKNSSSNRKLTNNDVVVVTGTSSRTFPRRTASAASSGSTSTNSIKGISTQSTPNTPGRSSATAATATKKSGDISYVPPSAHKNQNKTNTSNPATRVDNSKSKSNINNSSNNMFVQDKEVDFFSNPTILSRLIQNQKFTAAITRLEKLGPAEASVWVCTKRKLPAALQYTNGKASNASTRSMSSGNSGGGKGTGIRPGKDGGNSNNDTQYTFRQLPIHMACGSLFRVEDQKLRTDLEQLIARLVIAFPDGCARRDHQGRYPLHECIWYNAAPPIVSALLMAAPDIARIADMQGVTPAVLNEHRQCPNPAHKKMVRGMLKKSPEFWRTARKEAELRMKHRDIPSSDATITSTSVLASSVMDEETIASKQQSKNQQPGQQPKANAAPQNRQHLQQQQRQQLLQEVRQQQPEPQAAPVKPLEWSQLEKRAVALEQKLVESYEHIYVLNQQLNEVKGAKNALQGKVDKFANSDLGKRVIALEHDKDELQFHLARSQALLAKHGISLEEENLAEGMPPLPPLQIAFESTPTEETAGTTDEENEKLEEEEEDDGVKLSMEQQKLALLKEQLQMLNQDHLEYQERLQYYCEVSPDDQTIRSEITTDDFTAMTPISKFHPTRPEPDANASLIGGFAVPFTASPIRMPPVEEGAVADSSVVSQARSAGNSEAISDKSMTDDPAQASPSDPQPQYDYAGSGPLSSVNGDLSELDSVLMGAMELNGGLGLSPDLVALWRNTSIGGGTVSKSVEKDIPIDEEFESMGRLNVRPGTDDSSLVAPPKGAPQWRS